MQLKQKLISILWSRIEFPKDLFDIRDFFVFSGMGMLFYGLYQYSIPLSFSVCGVILMFFGLFIGKKGK